MDLSEYRTFGYKPEEGQNPYIGFMSFQHFRDESMFSDIVVRPEANRTETERVECYPISPDAEDLGREMGYYPDTSIVYIRILWKEFEPRRGEYNYKFIEDILENAKAHSQTLIFRLMAHSTRECDDVPLWLKGLIDCPDRPKGMRVKDSPTDPLFIDLFLEAVKKIGERFDTHPYLDAIDISLPGAWGEGHNLDLYPEDTFKRIVDTYTSVFKKTRLMTQLSRPNLIKYAKESANINIGWRGDGLGDPLHICEFYPPKIEKIKDNWKSAPVSFESYWWLCEWKRQGWDIDEIIEKTLFWHISSLNAKSMPVPLEWKEKIDAWVRKMGYHISLNFVRYTPKLSQDGTLGLVLGINNVGVAPIYNEMSLKIRLKSENDEYVIDTNTDIRSWLPGARSELIATKLPMGIKSGSYLLQIGICSELFPMIYLATDAQRDGEFYTVGSVAVE